MLQRQPLYLRHDPNRFPQQRPAKDRLRLPPGAQGARQWRHHGAGRGRVRAAPWWRVPDRAQLQQLDQALWSFSEQDFLPHVHARDPLAAQTPIILTADDSADLPHHQILINLGSDTPAHFARFERLLEIISADDADKAAGRDRYRFYKERGYPLTHHVAA